MKKPVLMAVVAALFCGVAAGESPTLAQIKQRGELRVGLEVGYMPFEMVDKSGAIIGFHWSWD